MRGKSLNKTFTLLLIASITLSFAAVAVTFAQTTRIFVNPSSGTADVGDYFHVDIEVEDVADLNMWTFNIQYNLVVLDLKELNITEGPFLSGEGATNFNVEVYSAFGYAIVACSLTGPVGASGSGVLASLDFLVLGNPPGICDLDLYDTALYDIDMVCIDHTVDDGYFYVEAPVPLYDWAPSAPLPNETVWFNASASFSPVGAEIVDYLWDFGDGTGTHHTTGTVISWYYADYRKVPYMVNLTVTDEFGLSTSSVKPLRIWRDIEISDIWVTDQNLDAAFLSIDPTEVGVPSWMYPPYGIVVTASNFGTQTETFNVTLSLDGGKLTQEGTVFLWPPTAPIYTITLAPGTGSGFSLWYDWMPTDENGDFLFPGDYNWTATATLVPGERADLGNIANNELVFPFEILDYPRYETVEIYEDKGQFFLPGGIENNEIIDFFNVTAINTGATVGPNVKMGWHLKDLNGTLATTDIIFKYRINGGGWSGVTYPVATTYKDYDLQWNGFTIGTMATDDTYEVDWKIQAKRDIDAMRIEVVVWNDTDNDCYIDAGETILSQSPPVILELDAPKYIKPTKFYVTPSLVEKYAPAECTTFPVEVGIEYVEDLFGFQFNLTWDPTLIELVPDSIHLKLDEYWGENYYASELPGSGWLAITATALPGATPITGPEVALVNLEFHVIYDPCYTTIDRNETCIFEITDEKASDPKADPITLDGSKDGTYIIYAVKPVFEIRPAKTESSVACDTFEVEVWLLNATKTYDYEVRIYYNTTILDVVNVLINTNDDWFAGPFKNKYWKVYDSLGYLEVWLEEDTGAPSVNGDGLLFTITFHVEKGISWKKGLTRTLCGNFTFDTSYSYVSVKCPATAKLYVSDGLAGANTGEYCFVPVPGDVNYDGIVDVKDLYLVATHMSDPTAVEQYDLNNNGAVDIFDLVLVAINYSP